MSHVALACLLAIDCKGSQDKTAVPRVTSCCKLLLRVHTAAGVKTTTLLALCKVCMCATCPGRDVHAVISQRTQAHMHTRTRTCVGCAADLQP